MKMNQQYMKKYHYKKNSGIDYSASLGHRMNIIAPYLPKKGKILELGCGEGLLSQSVQQKTGADVFGVDISSSGVNLAIKRGITASIADLNKRLPFPDSYFDLIFSDQVLEHVYNTDFLLSETYRILKPGGIMIIITPNLSFWLNRILFLFGVYPMFLEAGEHSKTYGTMFLKKYMQEDQAMGHIHVFNKPALEDIVLAHKFTLIRVFGSPLSWHLPELFRMPYNMLDRFFALFPSLARDIILIGMKHK